MQEGNAGGKSRSKCAPGRLGTLATLRIAALPGRPARAYLRFALNRYSTPTEIAKFTSVEVALSP
jgi:hypothetical protein